MLAVPIDRLEAARVKEPESADVAAAAVKYVDDALQKVRDTARRTALHSLDRAYERAATALAPEKLAECIEVLVDVARTRSKPRSAVIAMRTLMVVLGHLRDWAEPAERAARGEDSEGRPLNLSVNVQTVSVASDEAHREILALRDGSSG